MDARATMGDLEGMLIARSGAGLSSTLEDLRLLNL